MTIPHGVIRDFPEQDGSYWVLTESEITAKLIPMLTMIDVRFPPETPNGALSREFRSMLNMEGSTLIIADIADQATRNEWVRLYGMGAKIYPLGVAEEWEQLLEAYDAVVAASSAGTTPPSAGTTPPSAGTTPPTSMVVPIIVGIGVVGLTGLGLWAIMRMK